MILQQLINLQDLLRIDPKLFDDIKIPGEADKDVLLSEIFTRCALLEPQFPDTRIFKVFSDAFFVNNYHQFEKLLQVDSAEYDITSNYWSEKNRDFTTDRKSTNIGNSENTSQHAAYNSNTFDNDDKNIGTVNNNGTVNGTDAEKETVKGNNGRESIQTTLQRERSLAAEDAYSIIAKLYEKNLFYVVY